MQSEGLQAGFESKLIIVGSGALRCQDLRARMCVWGGSQGLEVQNFLGLGSGILLSWSQGLQDEGLDSQLLGLQGGRLGVTRSWGPSLRVRV